MTPQDRRFWINLTTSQSLDAVERDDFDAQDRLWALAATDSELEAAFLETHDAITEEAQAAALNPTIDAVRAAVLKHLPGVELDAPNGPTLFAALRHWPGLEMAALDVVPPTLERVFLDLTGPALRD